MIKGKAAGAFPFLCAGIEKNLWNLIDLRKGDPADE